MKYKLFSADDHVDLKFLPLDLWQKRVPAAYRTRAPRIEERPEGRRWMVDGTPFGGILGILPRESDASRGKPLGSGRDHAIGKNATPIEQKDGRWRATTPALRKADMHRDNVEAHVVYGPFMGIQLKDPELNSICLRAFNEWLVEFCATIPGRLYPVGTLPVHDAKAAVDEILRCATLGMKGVQFHALDAYKFHWDEVWEPLWTAAEETGVSISVHHAGGVWSCRADVHSPSFLGPPGRGVHATNQVTVMNRLDEVLCGLTLSGVLQRHPKLHVVLAESDLGWIPYILDRMDRKYDDRHVRVKRDDAADLDMTPSAYYKRQMSVTFDEDPVGIKMLDAIGPQTVMWSSDYPHADSTWPDSHAILDEAFKGIDPKITRMVVGGNARKLYA